MFFGIYQKHVENTIYEASKFTEMPGLSSKKNKICPRVQIEMFSRKLKTV